MPSLNFIRPAPTLSQVPLDLALEPAARELRLLSHRISAGFPSPATDYVEEGLDLNDYLVRNKPATFLFTVRAMRSENRSPRYTTRWDELPFVQ